MSNDTLQQVALSYSKTQQMLINSFMKELKFLQTVPFMPATHGLFNQYEEVAGVSGASFREFDAPNTEMDIETIMKQERLGVLAGEMSVSEERALLIANNTKDGGRAAEIYFAKRTRGRGYDYPQYCLHGRDWRRLKHMLRHNNVYLGVHGSYYGSIPAIEYSKMYRAHYLRCSIEQLQRLADAGYTDDFTMGFADQAGFRLQTCRAVRWINPKTMQLTNLTLHPLMVMDTTLSKYMHLTEDEAYFLCERLIAKVKLHHGDLCLLWHNNNFAGESYHRALYPKILALIK